MLGSVPWRLSRNFGCYKGSAVRHAKENPASLHSWWDSNSCRWLWNWTQAKRSVIVVERWNSLNGYKIDVILGGANQLNQNAYHSCWLLWTTETQWKSPKIPKGILVRVPRMFAASFSEKLTWMTIVERWLVSNSKQDISEEAMEEQLLC